MAHTTGNQPKHASNKVPMILGGAAIALALGIAVIAAKPGTAPATPFSAASQPATPAPVAMQGAYGLQARETDYDFGSISMAAGKVTHRYWFRNENTAPVLIRRIYTSCMCTTATFVRGMKVINSYGMLGHGPLPAVNQSLNPGEAAFVDVVFDPAAHGPAGLGPTRRVVTIESDAGQPVELRFAANVTP